MPRNDKGQYSSPSDKQIESDELENIHEKYVESLLSQKNGTKEKSVDTRRNEVRYWLAFCEANDIDPLDATEHDVRGYVQSTSGLKDTTRGSYFVSVSSFYNIISNDAQYDIFEDVNRNPCSEISLRKDYSIYPSSSAYQKEQKLSGENDDKVITVPRENIRKMVEHIPAKGDKRLMHEVLIKLLFYTGAREDELRRMRCDKIDWDECTIDIRSAKIKPEQNPKLVRRDVMFPKKFVFKLKRWVDHVRPSYSSHSEDSDYIFLSHQSPQLKEGTPRDIVKRAAREAGVQEPLRPPNPNSEDEVEEWLVTPHRIRRTAISHWVNDCPDIPIDHARRLAGHAKLSQTISYVEEDSEGMIANYQSSVDSL